MKQKFCQKWDLNPRPHTRTRILTSLPIKEARLCLESGALDHSAILTLGNPMLKIVTRQKKNLAERSFDLRTSGLWAQHASTAPLCYPWNTVWNLEVKTYPTKTFVVRSGIRTHAHRSGLRPERSALDLSAILTSYPTNGEFCAGVIARPLSSVG